MSLWYVPLHGCIIPPSSPDYFAHMAALNNLLTMAHQLKSDVQTSSSHRYIAHQTALLHVSLWVGRCVDSSVNSEGVCKMCGVEMEIHT